MLNTFLELFKGNYKSFDELAAFADEHVTSDPINKEMWTDISQWARLCALRHDDPVKAAEVCVAILWNPYPEMSKKGEFMLLRKLTFAKLLVENNGRTLPGPVNRYIEDMYA